MSKTWPSSGRWRPSLLIVTASGALASCAVGPNYRRPDLPVPAAYKGTATPAAPAPLLSAEWWTLFNDPGLTRLATETLAANPSIKAAIARVDQARESTRSAAGAFFPTLSVNPSVRRSGSAAGAATAYSLPLQLGFELDVWGRLRRQYEYYQDTEQASADDYVFVMQTVLAEAAQAYFTIRFYDREISLFEEALDLYRKQLELTDTKYKAGLALPTDLLQAQTQVYSATNQLIEVRRSRAKQEHAIAILLGRPPADYSFEPQPLTIAIPVVPAGLPVNLLDRRPDVAEAERQLAAANAQVGMAKADFFPSFSLTGSAGFDSSSAQHLAEWESRVWSIAPGLNAPLFQGGQLTAAHARAKARYQELVANYRTTVLAAFRDVEDQLSDLHLLADKTVSLDATIASAREYSRLTEVQYRQGLTTYLQVIDANQTLLTNELSAAQAHLDRLDATVLLIKAVGGGWKGEDAALPH
jgi:multidrug efflux system outer membrane protein